MAEEVEGLRTELSLDSSQYNTKIAEAIQQAKEFGSSFSQSTKKLDSQVNQNAKSVDLLGNSLKLLKDAALGSVDSINNSFMQLATALREPQKNIDALATSIKKINVEQTIKPISDSVMESIRQYQTTLLESTNAITQFKEEVQKSNTAVRRTLKTTESSFSELAKEVSNSIAGMNSSQSLWMEATSMVKEDILKAQNTIRASLKKTSESYVALATKIITSSVEAGDSVLVLTADLKRLKEIAPGANIFDGLKNSQAALNKLEGNLSRIATKAKDATSQMTKLTKAQEDSVPQVETPQEFVPSKFAGMEVPATTDLAKKTQQVAAELEAMKASYANTVAQAPTIPAISAPVVPEIDYTEYETLDQAIERVQSDTAGLTSNLAEAEAAIEKTGDSAAEAAQKMNKLGDTGQEVASTTDKVAKKQNALVSALSNVRAKVGESWNSMGDAVSKYGNEVKKATQESARLSNQSKNTGKDALNVFKGIVLAQGFYKAMNAVEGVVASMWEMGTAVETTQASLNILVGDLEKSQQLTQYIQDFAAASTFTFDTASTATRQLLAYGFQLENVGYIMNTIGDAAAAMGNPEAFDAVSKALGQIHTKGKVAAQEMLQLTEAGIPAYEILQEELGLTQKQLGNLGREGISADRAVQALLTGMEKRFKGSMTALSQTVPGLWNNLKESIAALGSEWMSPLYDSVKVVLSKASSLVNGWVATMRTSGITGVFESIFTDSGIQEQIRLLIANVAGLAQSFVALWQSSAPVRAEFVSLTMNLVNALLPSIQIAINTFNFLTQVMQQNAVGCRILASAALGLLVFKLIASVANSTNTAFSTMFKAAEGFAKLSTVFNAAAVSGSTLSGVLAVLKSVISGGIAVGPLIASVAAVGASMMAVTGMIAGASKSLSSALGNNSKAYLQPQLKKSQTAAESFNKTLAQTAKKTSGISDDFDKVAGSATKAKNAIASFDEVFTLPDETDSGGSGGSGAGGVGDIEIPEIDTGDLYPSYDDLFAAAANFNKNYEYSIANAFKPQTYWEKVWEDTKKGLLIGVEGLVGVFGGIPTALLNNVVEPIKAISFTAYDAITGNWADIPKVWSKCGADITLSWNRTWNTITGTYTKAMNIIKKSSKTDLEEVARAYNLALDKLPGITEDKMSYVALQFTDIWTTMSDDTITVLKGTSDTMGALFAGINKDMTKSEAQEQFVKNMEIMSDGGILTSEKLSQDVNAAMKALNDNMLSEGARLQLTAETVFGKMKDNAGANAEDMSETVCNSVSEMGAGSVGLLQSMGGSWAKIFLGIDENADMTSAQTKAKVTANIEKMKSEGTWNVAQMEKETTNTLQTMATNSDDLVKDLCSYVTNGTALAAKYAGTNTRLLAQGVDDALSVLPDQSAENIRKMRIKMIDGLTNTGALTLKEATAMKNGIMHPLEVLPKEAASIFGVALPRSVSDATQVLKRAGANGGWAFGNSFRTNMNSEFSQAIADMDAAKADLMSRSSLGNIAKTYHFNPRGSAPRYARGGLIKKNQIVEVGEQNRQEAILPLENSQIMGTVGNTIGAHVVESLSNLLGPLLQGNHTGTQENLRPLYVGTLVADERGLRELNKKMQIIEVQEDGRSGM